jgi:NAD(P)H-hydrate epimerase
MANMFPEATFLRLKGDRMDIRSGQHMARQIFEAVGDYKVLLIGCGFGTSRTTYRIFQNLVLSNIKLPQLVLDADGLNMLSKISNWWDKIPVNTILTPHPKEMSRLTRLPVSEIQSDRLNVAKRFSEQWGVIVVLKGANTVICDPNGSSIISPFANPILSSAGTGDVLAGLIAGFIGQGSNPLEASSLGVYIHGKTAESVSLQIGSSGLLATELANNVPFTIKYLRN